MTKPALDTGKTDGIDAKNTCRTQIQIGGNNTDISRTIAINLIFTGPVPPDLAALIRDAILAADAAAEGRPTRHVQSTPRQPPQNRP